MLDWLDEFAFTGYKAIWKTQSVKIKERKTMRHSSTYNLYIERTVIQYLNLRSAELLAGKSCILHTLQYRTCCPDYGPRQRHEQERGLVGTFQRIRPDGHLHQMSELVLKVAAWHQFYTVLWVEKILKMSPHTTQDKIDRLKYSLHTLLARFFIKVQQSPRRIVYFSTYSF